MSAVGVGVIGTGTISTQYLTNLTAFPDTEVRVLADLDVARAGEKAAEFGVPRAATVEDLLADGEVEIVVNLTIPAAHVDVTEAALSAGKHVWSEKPYALTRDDGARLLGQANAAGLRLASAPDTILGGALQTAQRAVLDGIVGAPSSGLVMFRGPGPEPWHPSPEFYYTPGGGPLLDMGPYYLSALVQLLGPVARVTAHSSRARTVRVVGSGPKQGTQFPVEVPTHYQALLELESGAVVPTIFSFDSGLVRTTLEVSGSDGTLVVADPNHFDQSSTLHALVGGEVREIPAAGVTAYGRGLGVLELARAIRADVPHRASAELAYHVLDVMVSIDESAREGGMPLDVVSRATAPEPLPLDWDPAAPTL